MHFVPRTYSSYLEGVQSIRLKNNCWKKKTWYSLRSAMCDLKHYSGLWHVLGWHDTPCPSYCRLYLRIFSVLVLSSPVLVPSGKYAKSPSCSFHMLKVVVVFLVAPFSLCITGCECDKSSMKENWDTCNLSNSNLPANQKTESMAVKYTEPSISTKKNFIIQSKSQMQPDLRHV